MIRRPPRSTQSRSSAASDVYKRQGPHGDNAYVSPGFFAALKIPLRKGRTFTDQDRQGSEPVIIVDETLAKQYWPNEDSIGKHMRRGSRVPWSTIVGVVAHVKSSDLAGD